MAEFWIFSNFLREKCDNSPETQKLCQQIAAKYVDNEKRELRAQNAREENLILKLDVGNLKSLHRITTENDKAQMELNSLLREFYKKQLKFCFDFGECEFEKLYGYEEINIELKARETINVYQQFYWRKVQMATKMEERTIVKKYRKKEQELLQTREECSKIEESLKKMKEKAMMVRNIKQEIHKCIFRLVKGSKDLENLTSKPGIKSHIGRTIKEAKTSEILNKVGLSSKLCLEFNQFKIPSIQGLSKKRITPPITGLSRLLQQAEVFCKSRKSFDELANNPQTPPSALKIHGETTKPQKSVSFDINLTQGISISDNIVDPTPSIPHITLDSSISEVSLEPEIKENQLETTKPKLNKPNIIILENQLLEPGGSRLTIQKTNNENITETKISKKRKITDEDHNYAQSPVKKKSHNTDKLDVSLEIGSKTFMDMFMDLSKEAAAPSSKVEPKKKVTQDSEKKLDKNDLVKKMIEEKEDVENNVDKKKIKKCSFNDFEDFFSEVADLAGSGSENNDHENDNENNDNNAAAEMSFDFFDGNENNQNDGDGDAGNDGFSFKF